MTSKKILEILQKKINNLEFNKEKMEELLNNEQYDYEQYKEIIEELRDISKASDFYLLLTIASISNFISL